MLFERMGELTALCIQMASDQNNYTQRHPRISQRRNVRTIFSIALHHEDCHIATNTWVFMHACSVIRVGLVAELSYGGHTSRKPKQISRGKNTWFGTVLGVQITNDINLMHREDVVFISIRSYDRHGNVITDVFQGLIGVLNVGTSLRHRWRDSWLISLLNAGTSASLVTCFMA